VVTVRVVDRSESSRRRRRGRKRKRKPPRGESLGDSRAAEIRGDANDGAGESPDRVLFETAPGGDSPGEPSLPEDDLFAHIGSEDAVATPRAGDETPGVQAGSEEAEGEEISPPDEKGRGAVAAETAEPPAEAMQGLSPEAPVAEPAAASGEDDLAAEPARRGKRGLLGLLFSIIRAGFILAATTLLVFGLVGLASYWVVKSYVGGKEVEVPNVCGLTLEDALGKLKPRLLYLELDHREYSDTVPRGGIIGQSPSPGMKVKARTPVKVVLSDGAAKVRVPSVVGMSEVNAGVALRAVPAADLDVGERAYAYSRDVEKGDVIAQDPPPGTPVLRGSRVNLLVSLGPPPVYYEMPDLREKTIQEARIALGAIRLQIAEVLEKNAPGVERGIIVGQVPPPGRPVKRGDRIVVTIASGLGGNPSP